MTYDLNDLNHIIKAKKKSFLVKLSALLISIFAFVSVALFAQNQTLVLISGIGIFVALLLIERLFSRSVPKVLFSKEIIGENIKEDEYEIMKRGSYKEGKLPHRQVGSRSVGTRSGAAPIAPNTRANKKAFHKSMHFSGEVYLKQSNGNIALISGLYPSHLEIYEEGDILIKPAGARFPIVSSRTLNRQPCPLCGEINGDESTACACCGLKIIAREV